jgi:hypothetical protein
MTGMPNPSFLYQDASWRTVVIDWDREFNTRLRAITTLEGPPLQLPRLSQSFEDIRAANHNSLALLDSRQIDANGKLPRHICGIAFGGWADAEDQVLSMHRTLSLTPEDTDDFRLRSNVMIAWIGLIRFNLANLSLVDATSPSALLRGAHESIDQTRQLLEDSKPYEPILSRALSGVPGPTQQVRQAMQFAVSGR